MARAFAVLALVAGTAIVCLGHSAEARVGETLLGFGHELSGWADAHPQSTPRALSLNGLELELMTVTTHLDVKHALDHFHESCRRQGGIREASAGVDGALRTEGPHEGVLACIDTGGPLGVSELAERLERFSESGNLAELGKLRYVLARRSGDTTTLLVLWTEHDARFFDAFPKSGDAPGQDPKEFPRAERMERLLSAAELGAPYGLTVYDAGQQEPEALLAWYEAELGRRGWSVSRAGERLTAQRGSRSVVLAIRGQKPGKTAVSIAELS